MDNIVGPVSGLECSTVLPLHLTTLAVMYTYTHTYRALTLTHTHTHMHVPHTHTHTHAHTHYLICRHKPQASAGVEADDY